MQPLNDRSMPRLPSTILSVVALCCNFIGLRNSGKSISKSFSGLSDTGIALNML